MDVGQAECRPVGGEMLRPVLAPNTRERCRMRWPSGESITAQFQMFFVHLPKTA
jgi:hypothetical protein